MQLTRWFIVSLLIFSFSCKHECGNPSFCLNGGVCINNSCQCPPGYSGERCEVRDGCYGLKCENGSTSKGDSCDCLPTFYGKNCDSSILHNKRYVVKNIDLISDISGPCRIDFTKYIMLNDTLLAWVTIKSKQVSLTLSNSNFKYEYSSINNSYFESTNNQKANCDYIDTYRGTYYNSGDSIHVVINRYYQSGNTYKDIITYDLIKIQ